MSYSEKNTSHLSDDELVELYKKTNETILIGAAYKRYAHLVFGMCLLYFKDKALANNNTFQIFERIISELKTCQIASFRTWLPLLVRKHCVSELQKMRVILIQTPRK